MRMVIGNLVNMSLVLSSLLLFTALEADLPTLELVPVDEAVRRLEACGLVVVEARYDDTIQDDVLFVKDPAPADQVLACAADVSVTTGSWVEVSAGSREAYFTHYQAISRERNRAWARARLAQHGLLDAAPSYVANETDDQAFADRLERLCGDAAKGALQSEFGPHSISPVWVESRGGGFEETGEVLMCLMTYAAAAGFEMGFIGNEKAAEPD
jgi:hypothetical protein